VSRDPVDGAVPATVTRIVSLGFEIRLEAKASARGAQEAGDIEVWAQLTAPAAKALNVQPGDTVYFRVAAPSLAPTSA
jgi:sulfate transport system ATP-binding protein